MQVQVFQGTHFMYSLPIHKMEAPISIVCGALGCQNIVDEGRIRGLQTASSRHLIMEVYWVSAATQI